MSSKKHELTEVDLNKAYEENTIKLKGIMGFTIGLVILIVFTFGLMWIFLGQMRSYNNDAQTSRSPLARSAKEMLPPEPRLQVAPGFGIDGPNGRINLELREPQSEYRELVKIWNDEREHGIKDPKTGMVSMLPLDEAKKKLLESNVKAKAGDDAAKLYDESRKFYSDSSAGRVASETRR